MKEIIRIQISKFLSDELVEQIAQKQWHSQSPAFVNRSRQYIFDEITDENDCFGVVALTAKNEVVGRLHCVRNKENIKRWYYGDLFVIPEYRRMGIATQMIEAAKNQLSEIGAQSLCCYVELDNIASRQLQKSVGFNERPFCTFNDFTNDGEIMYEFQIVDNLCIIPATENEAYFVRILFVQNKEKLSVGNIDMNEWKEILTEEEITYYKRGRNSHHSKNRRSISVSSYKMATGFEAMIGFLHINKRNERIDEILQLIIKIVEEGLL